MIVGTACLLNEKRARGRPRRADVRLSHQGPLFAVREIDPQCACAADHSILFVLVCGWRLWLNNLLLHLDKLGL